jgi:hypothetical protein
VAQSWQATPRTPAVHPAPAVVGEPRMSEAHGMK